jgi:hypothetical protein
VGICLPKRLGIPLGVGFRNASGWGRRNPWTGHEQLDLCPRFDLFFPRGHFRNVKRAIVPRFAHIGRVAWCIVVQENSGHRLSAEFQPFHLYPQVVVDISVGYCRPSFPRLQGPG